MRRHGDMTMSFLDVLCSAMGGMIVLAVIFSVVKNPVPIPKLDEFILLAVEASGEERALGVLIAAPQQPPCAILNGVGADVSRQLEVSAVGGARCWTVQAGDAVTGQKTIFYVEVRDPVPGQWTFRPYVVDWPEGGTEVTEVQIVNAWTRNGPVEFESATAVGPVAVPMPGDQVPSAYAVMIR